MPLRGNRFIHVRNSARVAQCVTTGVVPPVVRISGTVIVKRVRGKMDKVCSCTTQAEKEFVKRKRLLQKR